MKVVSLIGALVLAAPLALGAQQSAAPAATQPAMPPGFEIPKDMTNYFVAIYVRGPKYTAAQSPEQTELTRQHLKYIRKMIEEKKYVFAGPLLDGGDKLGIAVVAAATVEDAKRIAANDPAIAAGHMAPEIHPAMLPSLASLVVKY